MVHHGEPDPNVAGEHHGWVRQFSEISRGVCDNIQGGIQVLHLGSVDLDLRSSPCWLVSYCSYLLPKQGGGTYRIQVNPTKVHDRNSHLVPRCCLVNLAIHVIRVHFDMVYKYLTNVSMLHLNKMSI